MKKITLFIIILIALAVGLIVGRYAWQAPSISLGQLQNLPAGAAATPISVVSIYENASTSAALNIEYPQFPDASSAFNQAISSTTLGLLADFQQNSGANESERTSNGAPALPPSAFSFNASWANVQSNSRYISFIERYSSFDGGANEDNDLQTFNYDMTTGQVMTLADLFPNVPNYLQQISQMARQQLTDNLNQATNGNVDQSMIDAGTQPTPDNFQFFTFNDYDVTIYFPQYSVAPGSAGEQTVIIPRTLSL